MIDPGHPSYESDLGVTADDGSFLEVDFNYNLARLVVGLLDTWILRGNFEPGFVTLTRGFRETMSLSDRGREAQEMQAQLVVSIHVNANDSPSVKGLTTYYKPGDNVGALMAKEIKRLAPRSLLRTSGGVYQTSTNNWTSRAHNVLKYHTAPAVLVECGFATNPGDLKAMQDKYVQLALANAIVSGVAHGAVALEDHAKA